MFENNPTVEGLYNRFEIARQTNKSLVNKHNKLIIIHLFCMLIGTLLTFTTSNTLLAIISFLLLISVFSFGAFESSKISQKIHPIHLLSYKEKLKLNRADREVQEYIANPINQFDIIEFITPYNKLINAYELKKSFALKDYGLAKEILDEVLTELSKENQQLAEQKAEKELIKEYETNLIRAKMKL